jgi:hypothetical protein
MTPPVASQLTTELAPRNGRRGLALSASKELEPGVRAMLVLAEGLFRLDVRIRGDSLQTFIRNLTDWPLDFHGDVGDLGGPMFGFSDASEYAPGHADLGFRLGSGDDLLLAKFTIATLQFVKRGTVKVSALGIVRQTGGDPPPRVQGA